MQMITHSPKPFVNTRKQNSLLNSQLNQQQKATHKSQQKSKSHPDPIPNNKMSSSPTNSIPDSNMEVLSPDQIGQIVKIVLEMVTPILEGMVERLVDRLMEKSNGPPLQENRSTQWGQPPSHIQNVQFVRLVNSAVLNSETIKEKSTRAVIEKLPEGYGQPEDLVEQIAKECGVEEELIKEDVHRHPREMKSREKTGKARILKVPFRTQVARDHFIWHFREGLRKNSAFPQNLSIRRDMTRAELDILYDLRRQAWEDNKTEGLFKYIVVDLQIKELSNPKPLRTRTSNTR